MITAFNKTWYSPRGLATNIRPNNLHPTHEISRLEALVFVVCISFVCEVLGWDLDLIMVYSNANYSGCILPWNETKGEGYQLEKLFHCVHRRSVNSKPVGYTGVSLQRQV